MSILESARYIFLSPIFSHPGHGVIHDFSLAEQADLCVSCFGHKYSVRMLVFKGRRSERKHDKKARHLSGRIDESGARMSSVFK